MRKRVLRASEQALVVEGAELLRAALEAGCRIEAVFVAPEGRASPAVAEVVAAAFAAGTRVFDLAPGVIERMTDTVTPQPVVAVVGFSPAPLTGLEEARLVLVCVAVRDPGNMGTMIRTADAAGADAVVCCVGTVDPTNPKTVRASAGSLFHVPVVSGGPPEEVLARLRGWGMSTVGAEARTGTDYARFDWCQRVALVFGNEASGLDEGVRQFLDHRVSIPMVGRAESLNVSVATAVLCFEALRQRRDGGGAGGTPPAPGPSGPTMPGMESGPDPTADGRRPGSGDGPR